MTKKLLSTLFLLGLIFSGKVSAQCVTITCPGDVTMIADSTCSAVVTYSAPSALNTCISVLDSTTFNYSGAIELFIVPAGVTSITVKTWGAQGGGATGGLGAYIQGDITVTPGDTLKILAGQQGQTNYGYGGGGGSFVATINNVPLVVAGGGGGAEHNNNFPGFNALTTNDGMNVESALGGVAGSGGEIGNPNTSGCGWSGSGGGGFYGDGGVIGDGGGSSFINGGAGGIDPTANCVVAGTGGFGGGGASGNAGGGGGGYSGGAGGANIGLVPNRGGGGGGSYNSGSNQVNNAGVQSGNGLVVLVYDATGPAYVSLIQGLGSGATFPIGVTTEVYVVTDSLSSTDTCSFTVTVIDTLVPTITCPANVSSCNSVVTGIAANAIDLCSTPTIDYVFSGATSGSGTGDASGSSFNIGSTDVIYTATDGDGNSSSCLFTITNTAPTVTANASDTTVCVYDGSVTLTGTPVGGTWSGSGVTGASFDPSVAGNGSQTLTYSYTDTLGCMNSANVVIVVDACLGITQINGASNWMVYPNPSNDVVNIQFDKSYTKMQVEITQANGQVVRHITFSGQDLISLPVNDLENGIYFLTINADQSEQIVKLIKN